MIVTLSPASTRAIDDAIRVSDQQFRDGFFHALLLCTVVVLIGVFLEEAETLPLPFRRFRIDPSTGLIAINHTLDRVLRCIARIGWLLIIAGVLGEGLFEELASRADSILQDFDEILITEAQRNALSAEAGTINLEIELAKQKARAFEAEKDLEGEKIERLKLEALVSPRRLTIDEQQKIGMACANLYKYGASKRIKVSSYGMDGEGTALAMEISSALNSSHLYTQNDLGGFIQTGGFDTGVLIATPPEDEKFASCFAKALSDIGHLKEVKVNPDRHVASVKMGGTVRMGGIGTMGGGGQIAPGAPLPAGSAVDIMVAVKPIEVAAAPN